MNVSQMMSNVSSESLGPQQRREDGMIREKLLQQVVLEQKQRIKEMEQKLQVQDGITTSVSHMKFTNEMMMKNKQIQQLHEKVEGMEEQLNMSREQVMELLQQREEQSVFNKQQSDLQKREFEQEVFAYRQECELQVQELEQENTIIQSQLEKLTNLPKALENYTSEEQYIQQVQELKSFIASVKEDYMAEIQYYKKASEQTRQSFEKVQQISEEEKRMLKAKLDELKEVDVMVEQEVLGKFSNLNAEMKKITNEITRKNQEVIDLKSNNIEEIQRVLDEKYEGEHIWLREEHELKNQLKQMQVSQDVRVAACEREFETTSQLRVIELEKHINENTVLLKEKDTLQRVLRDMKELAGAREGHLKSEVERFRRQTVTLMDASKNRESILEEEIKRLNLSVSQLHKAFESRESLFLGHSSRDEQIHNIIQRFGQVNQDLKLKLEGRKGNDVFKDFKVSLCKLVEKLNDGDKCKSVIFEKKLSDKRVLDRQVDRFITQCNDHSSRLEGFLHRVHNNVDTRLMELDVTRYEQMLMKKDADILLAKQNLVQFAQHYKHLEDRFNGQRQTSTEVEYQKLEQQIINQKREIQQLQTERQISLELRQRYEQHFNQELRRIENQILQQPNEVKKVQRSITPTIMTPNNTTPTKSSSRTTQSKDQIKNTNQRDVQQLIQSCTELKIFVQDIEKNYLNNQVVTQLTQENQVLQARVEEMSQQINVRNMEVLIQYPSKAFEETCQTFQREIGQLVLLRQSVEEAVQERAVFFQNLEQSSDERIHGVLEAQQTEDLITQLRQEVQMLNEQHAKERGISDKELSIAMENLQSMQCIHEKKLDVSLQEVSALRRSMDNIKHNNQTSMQEWQKDLKSLKNEVQSLTKIMKETQQKRLEERKRYVANLKQIEVKVVAKQDQSIQVLNKKMKWIGMEFDKKVHVLQQRTNFEHHENVIDVKVDDLRDKQFRQQMVSMNEELSTLRERDRDRGMITSRQFSQVSTILGALQKDIHNLHKEKSSLIEEVDYQNQLLNVKDKSYAPNLNTYSFRV